MNSVVPCVLSSGFVSTSAERNRYWINQANREITVLSATPNAKSPRYERWSRDMLQRWTQHELGDARWDHLVDLGCGFGDFTTAFAQHAAKVTACDLAPPFVAETARRLAGHPDASVHVSDIVSFDAYHDVTVAYLGSVLMYLNAADIHTVLARLRSRCAPDAVVAQRDWCVLGLGREKVLEVDERYSEHRKPSTYVRMFEAAGFRLRKYRASPLIYGTQMTRDALRAPWLVTGLGWLPQFAWRLGTVHWTACSTTFVYELR